MQKMRGCCGWRGWDMWKFEPTARLRNWLHNLVKQGFMCSKQKWKWMLARLQINKMLGTTWLKWSSSSNSVIKWKRKWNKNEVERDGETYKRWCKIWQIWMKIESRHNEALLWGKNTKVKSIIVICPWCFLDILVRRMWSWQKKLVAQGGGNGVHTLWELLPFKL